MVRGKTDVVEDQLDGERSRLLVTQQGPKFTKEILRFALNKLGRVITEIDLGKRYLQPD